MNRNEAYSAQSPDDPGLEILPGDEFPETAPNRPRRLARVLGIVIGIILILGLLLRLIYPMLVLPRKTADPNIQTLSLFFW